VWFLGLNLGLEPLCSYQTSVHGAIGIEGLAQGPYTVAISAKE